MGQVSLIASRAAAPTRALLLLALPAREIKGMARRRACVAGEFVEKCCRRDSRSRRLHRLRMIRSLAVLAGLLLAALPMRARAQDYVVIDSSVPALQVGATLAAGAPLDLPDKTRLVLVSASGQVLTVNGPYRGPPPAASGGSPPGSGDVLKVIPTLLGNSDSRQSAGVVRGTDWRAAAANSLGDVTAIDATDGGDACLFDARSAELVHNPSNAGPMKIQSMSNGTAATVKWDSGALRQPWPASLPLADGDTFLFEGSGDNATAMATIHLLPAAPAASDVARAAQMARAGCDDQARLLLAVIAKSAK
jgi:hypothetical protein